MMERPMPFSYPVFYKGQYKEDKIYPLFIQMITCSFKLKKNKIPTIQIKNSMSFMSNEYLESSKNQIVTLVLTSIDLKLFLEHYDVYDLEYVAGWKFKSIEGLFTKYIDKWIKRKNEATISGNKGQRTLSKLMLNSLYGKFATSLDVQSKIPFIGDDDCVHYALSEKDRKDGIYIPIGCFITAYAREKTIRTSQAIKEYSINKYGRDLYYYSDTDSIHTGISEEELKKFCDIDPVRLRSMEKRRLCKEGKIYKTKMLY